MSDSSKIEELECQVADLKEKLQEALLSSIFQLSPSNLCRRMHIQNCHICDAYECCDNRSPARHQIDVMVAREKKVRAAAKTAHAMMHKLAAYCDNEAVADAGTVEAHQLAKAMKLGEKEGTK